MEVLWDISKLLSINWKYILDVIVRQRRNQRNRYVNSYLNILIGSINLHKLIIIQIHTYMIVLEHVNLYAESNLGFFETILVQCQV